jgi:hypothetical protein
MNGGANLGVTSGAFGFTAGRSGFSSKSSGKRMEKNKINGAPREVYKHLDKTDEFIVINSIQRRAYHV